MTDYFIFFLNCFVTLFSILDPFGAAATLLALTPGDSEDRRVEQARRAVRAMVIILLVFTAVGGLVFRLFGISVEALMVAGGLILIQLAFRMLSGASLAYRSSKPERDEAETKEDIAIIPMAIPILAGPAAITAVIVFANRSESPAGWAALLLAIAMVTLITHVVLINSQRIAEFLGDTGLRILMRVMGLVLVAMGVEFVLSGVKGYFAF